MASRWFSESQVLSQLDLIVQTQGSHRKAAETLKIPRSRVSEYLSGKRRLTKTVIARLGFDPSPHYRRI